MSKNTKIDELTTLAETKFLSLYNAKYTNKKGNIKNWIIASRKDYDTLNNQFFRGKEEKIDAVIIAAIHKDSEKLVLVKQFRVPINDYIYELPAGLIDGDEDIEAAVRRELKEETGLNLLNINHEKSKVGIYASAGMTDESVAMAYCLCDGEVSDEFLEDDEDIETILVDREEAKKLLGGNVKFDVRALMALQMFVEVGRKVVD